MFDLDFFTFEFFGGIVLFASAIVPLFAEWHDWLPDWSKDFAGYLKGGFDLLASKVKEFFDFLIVRLKEFVTSIVERIVEFATSP
jgi:hypothetical protein